MTKGAIAGGQYHWCLECYEYTTRREDRICWHCISGRERKNAIVDKYEVPTPIRFPLAPETILPCMGKEDQFLKPNAGQKQRDLCHACPAYAWCLEWGIENDEWGTWGGLSQAERRKVKAGLPALTQDAYTLIA